MVEDIEALKGLPSLQPFLQHFTALVSATHPPQSILIHAPTNSSLVLPLITYILSNLPSAPSHSSSHSPTQPTIQQLLPNHASLDLLQLNSPRAAFDTILNHLSGWHTQEEPLWDPKRGGVSNWDGRVDGLRVDRVNQGSNGKGKRKAPTNGTAAGRKRIRRDDSTIIPDSETEDQEDEEEERVISTNAEPSPHWRLTWDRTLPPPTQTGTLLPIRDSIESFHYSLSKILSLGAPSPSSSTPPSFADSLFAPDEEQQKPKHRFIVFNNGELLPDLAAPGNVGGAPKETGQGMTFESTVRRLGELSRLPITSITISTLSVPKSRGDMVGLLEPTLVEFPDLGAALVDNPSSTTPTLPDPVLLLTSRFALQLPNPLPPSPPTNSTNPYLPLSREDLIALFQSLAKVIWDLFSKYLVEVEQLAELCARYWGKWRGVVEGSNPPIAPTNASALASHLRSDFTYERSLLGISQPSIPPSSPSKPSLPTAPTQEAAPAPALHGFTGLMPALPPPPTFLANPGSPGTSSQASVFSPLPSSSFLPHTPVRKPLPTTTSSQPLTATSSQALLSSQTLSKSLPRLARFLLIAAHYASFNSPKSDVRCFVKVDESVARKGKKGKTVRRKAGSPVKAKLTTDLSGAKPFPLERLIAIFEAIVSERIEFQSMARSWDVGGLIASLLSLRLLHRVSSSSSTDKLLTGIKLRSTLGKEAVDVLARSVGFGEWGEMLGEGE
ncbi:origin recognition complex subunit 5 C-terminus-domain-containing protein [Leucosporidium creatinivorum]|uniref:Origin recognition complex subunit 5 C-terminus-domain-containing protein n=1 Tax=Leucosporidium creatinivorum TaxID=106004 RepID=A0A1Y2ERS2_9BASI|nr:origin recognition complex subunit 5 C-terminus-domain-containing protein [Leucosporidium creatinivorum]